MSWEDVNINRELSGQEVIGAMAELFVVDPDKVVLSIETDDWVDKVDDFRVACVMYSMSGDFPTRIDIIPLEASLIPDSREEAVGRLCEILDCHVIVGWGGGTNPYIWTLVRGKNDYQEVMVDSDLLDNEENPGFVIREYLE